MTPAQLKQMKRMHAALRRIANDYQTPQQLERGSEKQYGLLYTYALEMSYENIQAEASAAIKGVRIPKESQ